MIRAIDIFFKLYEFNKNDYSVSLNLHHIQHSRLFFHKMKMETEWGKTDKLISVATSQQSFQCKIPVFCKGDYFHNLCVIQKCLCWFQSTGHKKYIIDYEITKALSNPGECFMWVISDLSAFIRMSFVLRMQKFCCSRDQPLEVFT